MFCEPENIVQQVEITDQPFAIEIVKSHLQKIYVVSGEKQISVFDEITLGPSHGDNKIETLNPIVQLGFHSDKIYVALKSQQLLIFSQVDL